MRIPSTLRTSVTLLCVTLVAITPVQVQACGLWDWLTGRSTTAVPVAQPPAISFAPQVTANYPVQQTVFQPVLQAPVQQQVQTVHFMPQTTYRTELRSVPVTVYRPIPVYHGNQPGPPTTVYHGCTTNRFQVQRTPYLTHHPVVSAAPAPSCPAPSCPAPSCPDACGPAPQPAAAAGPGYYTPPAGSEQWVPRDQAQVPGQFAPQGQSSQIQGSQIQGSQQFDGSQVPGAQASPWEPTGQTYGDPGQAAPPQYGNGQPADQRPTLNRPTQYEPQQQYQQQQYQQQYDPSQVEQRRYITPSPQPEQQQQTEPQPSTRLNNNNGDNNGTNSNQDQSSYRGNPAVNATPATITPPVTIPQARGVETRNPSAVVPIPDPQFTPQGPSDEAPSLLDPRDKTVSIGPSSGRGNQPAPAVIPVSWNEPQPKPFSAPQAQNQSRPQPQAKPQPKPAFDDSGWVSVGGK